MKPLISVIVNCYNGGKYLQQALESVLAQTYTNWELIFWDNRSTDRSAEIFHRYSDSRLRYFLAPKHTRLYEARNYAIEQARAEFVAFLDVDDYPTPQPSVSHSLNYTVGGQNRKLSLHVITFLQEWRQARRVTL